jgi:putative lipoprotein
MTISFAGTLRAWAIGTLAAFALAGCGSSVSLAEPAVPLEGTQWTLSALRGAPVGAAAETPNLLLQADQKLASGTSGCNRFSGNYTLAGDRLTFGHAVSTRMMCIKGMEQEQAFLEAMIAVASWKIDGKRLELRDARGQSILQFVKTGS